MQNDQDCVLILWEIPVWKLMQLPNLKLILNQFSGISNKEGREIIKSTYEGIIILFGNELDVRMDLESGGTINGIKKAREKH